MQGKVSLKKNIVMSALLTISSFIFQIITFPYISRVLLPVGTGKVGFATSFIAYFSMVAQMGIPIYGIRACASVRDNKEELSRVTQELLIINLVMSAIAYAVLFPMLAFIPRLHQEKNLYLVISVTILFNAIGMEWLYRALEKYTYITIRSVIFKAVALLAMLLLVHKESDYVVYGGISVLAASASNIFNFFHARHYVYVKPVGNYHFSRHFKAIIVFFAMTIATTVYTNLDTVMLGFMKTDQDVGYYDAAVKIKKILVSIITSLGAALLPRVSYYIEKGFLDEFKRICNKAIEFIFVVATPMMIYFMLFAKEGILLLSGRAYMGAVEPMLVIMPTILFIGISNITGIQILVPLQMEKYVLRSEIIGGIVDFIINLLLIPSMGATGAAVGTLVAEFLVLIYQSYVIKNQISSAFKSVDYFKILIGIIVAIAISFGLKYVTLNTFVIIILSALLFFGTYYISLLLLKEPIIIEVTNTVKKVFARKVH